MLKASIKQVTNPFKRKNKTIKGSILGNPDDDEVTYTEHIGMFKGTSSQYACHADTEDVDNIITDAFVNDTLTGSPRKDATFESNIEEIHNLDVTINT